MNKKIYFVTGAASLLCLSGCGSSSSSAGSTSTGESVTEIAGSSVAGAANATENGGSVAFIDRSAPGSSLKEFLARKLAPESAAFASTYCPTLAGSSCSGSSITMSYSSCSFLGASAVWSGSQVLTFTSGTCTTNPQANSVSFTRTFGVGTTRVAANGETITLNTATAAGYSNPVSGGIGVVWSGGSRVLTINGIEYVATSAAGTKLFDHSVNSGALSVTGTGASRSVAAGGTIVVQHNIAKYTGTVTVAQALTFSAGCCYPTGGQLTTVLSGSQTGTESLTYQSTCGTASLTNSSGTSTITLNQCL